METLKNIKNWVCSSIFEPLFGQYWNEISFIIIALLLIFLISIIIILSVCYIRMKKTYCKMRDTYKDLKIKNNDLSDRLRYEKQDCGMLKKDLENSHNTIKVIKEEIKNLKEKNESLNNDLGKSEETIHNLKIKIDELKIYKERSDRAKKAAEARKNNKNK